MIKRLLLGLTLLLVMGVSSSFAQSNTRICVQSGDNCIPVDGSAPLPVYLGGNSFNNITIITDTNVKASAGVFVGLSVNTAGGAGSTASVYNDADGTCDTNLIGTFSVTAINYFNINAAATTGICVHTAGVTPANLTILYR